MKFADGIDLLIEFVAMDSCCKALGLIKLTEMLWRSNQ